MFQVPPRDGKPGLADFIRCVTASTPLRVAQNDRAITVLLVALTMSIIPQLHADIPWPEVVQRLAYENDKLRDVRRDTTVNTSSCARCITHRRNRVLL